MDYEMMVKCAYEEIMGFEKEASGRDAAAKLNDDEAAKYISGLINKRYKNWGSMSPEAKSAALHRAESDYRRSPLYTAHTKRYSDAIKQAYEEIMGFEKEASGRDAERLAVARSNDAEASTYIAGLINKRYKNWGSMSPEAKSAALHQAESDYRRSPLYTAHTKRYNDAIKEAYEEIMGFEKEAAGYAEGVKTLGKKLTTTGKLNVLKNGIANEQASLARLRAKQPTMDPFDQLVANLKGEGRNIRHRAYANKLQNEFINTIRRSV